MSIVHVRAHAGEVGNEVADVLAKEGAEFDSAYEVARNHKYMDAIAGALPHTRRRAAAPQCAAQTGEQRDR